MTDNTTPITQDDNSSAGGGGFQFVIPPHPNTDFDETEFLTLLKGSISLNLAQKKEVLAAIPRLSIEEIMKLVAIFKEEIKKFDELEGKHGENITTLKNQRRKELDKEIVIEGVKVEEQNETQDDEDEAERIKRELGL